jgi:hypothetical protein
MENGELVTSQIFEAAPETRPARQEREVYWLYAWEGYITGSFMMGDKTPCLLQRCQVAETTPAYKAYMLMPWTPLLIGDRTGVVEENGAVRAPLEYFEEIVSGDGLGSVRQAGYWSNEIDYQVSLSQPVLMVENEIYYTGWQATLTYPDGRTQQIQAVESNGVFRGWELPAGQYQMRAFFRFPHLETYAGVSLLGVLIWLGAILVHSRWSRKFRDDPER